MIYIVCVIHVVYWFKIGEEPLRSFILFEMPAIFFISGAAQSLNNQQRNIRKTIVNRFKRVIVPYYVFLMVLLLFMSVYTCINEYLNYDYSKLTIMDIIKILMTGGSAHIPYYGYTWFISVYFIISCSLPIQQKIIKRTGRHLYTICCLTAALLLHFLTLPTADLFIKELFYYNFFMILGYLYYKRIGEKKLLFITVLLLLITIYGFINGIMIPMQGNKFPPNIYYLIFGLTVLCVCSLIFGRLSLKNNKILSIWNERGYTIYLYQSISHFIIYICTYKWIQYIPSKILVFTIYFSLVFTLTTWMSKYTYSLEKRVTGRLFKPKA